MSLYVDEVIAEMRFEQRLATLARERGYQKKENPKQISRKENLHESRIGVPDHGGRSV